MGGAMNPDTFMISNVKLLIQVPNDNNADSLYQISGDVTIEGITFDIEVIYSTGAGPDIEEVTVEDEQLKQKQTQLQPKQKVKGGQTSQPAANNNGNNGAASSNFLVKLAVKTDLQGSQFAKLLGIPLIDGIVLTKHPRYEILGFVLTSSPEAYPQYAKLIKGVNFFASLQFGTNKLFGFIKQVFGVERVDLYVAGNKDVVSLEAALGLRSSSWGAVLSLRTLG
jgi:hypothetical protein